MRAKVKPDVCGELQQKCNAAEALSIKLVRERNKLLVVVGYQESQIHDLQVQVMSLQDEISTRDNRDFDTQS